MPCRVTASRHKLIRETDSVENPMKIGIKYVVEDTDRHGNVRVYLRKPGLPKVRLSDTFGSPEFWVAYHNAVANPPPEPKAKAGALVKGSKRWLVGEYFKSAMFKELDPKTQTTRRGILERFCANESDGEKPSLKCCHAIFVNGAMQWPIGQRRQMAWLKCCGRSSNMLFVMT